MEFESNLSTFFSKFLSFFLFEKNFNENAKMSLLHKTRSD